MLGKKHGVEIKKSEAQTTVYQLQGGWRSWPTAPLPARQCEEKKQLYRTLLNQGGDADLSSD